MELKQRFFPNLFVGFHEFLNNHWVSFTNHVYVQICVWCVHTNAFINRDSSIISVLKCVLFFFTKMYCWPCFMQITVLGYAVARLEYFKFINITTRLRTNSYVDAHVVNQAVIFPERFFCVYKYE